MRLSACLALAVSINALAQSGATARLSGTVTDPSGGRIQNQIVSIRSLETNQLRTATTGSDGYYSFADVTPGVYELTSTVPGFHPVRTPPVELLVGAQARLDVQLQLAEVTQTDTVTAAPNVVEPTRTDLSEVIETRRIDNLPINGRQFLDFVLLTPNVHAGRSNIANPATPGEPKQVDLSFAGLHESTNLVLVDGANNTNRVFGRSRSAPSQEAVREFRVLNDTYTADLGPATGGVVSIIVKSGTNDLHGSVYEYFRNDALDARNILAPTGFDELRQNQYGFTVGGPLIRNRLFAFANFEGQNRRESPFYSSVLLNNLDAINQQKTALGLPPEVLAGKLRKLDYDTALLRVDYQQSDKTDWSFGYRFRQDRDENLPAATNQLSAPSNFRNATIGDHNLTTSVNTALNAHVLNQGLLQFAHRDFEFPSVSYEPHLQIANTLDLGRHFNAVNAAREKRFEAGDSLSVSKGTHTFRFGGNVSVTHDQFFYDPFDPAYAVFPNLNAFLGKAPFASPFFAVTFGFAEGADGTRPNAPRGFTGPANLPTFDQTVRPSNGQTNLGLFVQDQWRATPKLTVNYGTRWDVDWLPERYFAAYYKALQPRVGVAYQLTDRVVLRAGAGAYQGQAYSLVYLIAMVAGLDSAFGTARPGYGISENTLHSPFYSNPAQATQVLAGFLKTGVYPVLNPTNFTPAQQFISTINRFNHGGPYSYQWNAQADMKLGRDWALSLSYLGVKGLALPSAFGGNVAPTNLTLATGKADYEISSLIPVSRTLNPLMSPLSFFFDASAQSIYHSGTIALSKRFARRFALTSHYTWSKTIDDSGDPSLNGFPEDPYRRYLERANSKQNIPHRFIGSFTADGPTRWRWLRDFRFALTATAQSPNYYTVFAGTDVNHDGNANTDRVGTLGRETYRGDSLVDFDLRLSRRLRLTERLSGEVIAEAFNVLNRLNVTDINTVYGAPSLSATPLASFGAIRATDPPRQIQFAFRLRF